MKKNTNLSKSTLIRSIQCQKSLYLYKYYFQQRDKISEAQQATFNRGHSIGELAQDLFPGGKNVAPKSPFQYQQSLKATAYLIQQEFPVIYEAAFRYEGILIFLDILVFRNDKWYAYEVKSSKRISQTYIRDAAIQHFVIKNSGLTVEDFSIIYVNENYDYETTEEWKLDDIFKECSVLMEINELEPFVVTTIQEALETLSNEDIPAISMGEHCDNPYPCDFKGFCSKTKDD